MRSVGSAFKLKISFEELEKEKTPNFDLVLEDWINGTKRNSFADPGYVLEITYITPPLRMFIERIVERLKIPVIVGSQLERGFGFGKSHAIIFLWHLFTSDIYRRADVKIDENIARETLVLGLDGSAEKPFVRIVEELKAFADIRHPVALTKDPNLLRAVAEVLNKYSDKELYTLSSEELAGLIREILERYRDLGGTPRLLVLIDELGYGLEQRLRSYADKEADPMFNEANALVNFLSYLYSKAHGVAAGVVIWVVADQDRKQIEAIAEKNRDKEIVYNKIKGLLKDLDVIAERYRRGLGGTSMAELSYSPEHALEIARYRVLKTVGDLGLEELQNEYIEWLESVSRQLNLTDAFSRFKEDMKKFYPFSLGLINLLKKLMSSRDAPGTEFVRTVIGIVGEAAQKALSEDPDGTYTIGVKHLKLPSVVMSKVMGEFEADWIGVAGDIELALSKIGQQGVSEAGEGGKLEEQQNIYEVAAIAAKYMLAKGVTANIMEVLEAKEKRDIEKYGTSLEELQLEVLETYTESKALQIIEKLNTALERLLAESARIEEREVDGKKYHLPSLFKTVYNKLVSSILEEKDKLNNKNYIPIYILKETTLPSLFTGIRVVIDGRDKDIVVALMEYKTIKDVDAMISNEVFKKAQSDGMLLLVLVPPWDVDLFRDIYISGKSYDDIVNGIANRLQDAVRGGRIGRPLHVVILLPNIAPAGMNRVLDMLATHVGTRKFLDYLSKEERIIDERLKVYEDVFVKRKDLLSYFNAEIRKKHLQILQSRAQREITEAKEIAQKQLVSLSRSLVAEVLGLYQKAIYYSIEKNSFISRDIVSNEAAETREEIIDLAKYASIVNTFLAHVVKTLGYRHDIAGMLNALLDGYRSDFEKGVRRGQDRIGDILENLMLGTYGIKPLSADVAKDVVKGLNNQRIDLKDASIAIKVDESAGLIRFDIEKKENIQIQISSPQQPRPEGLGVTVAETAIGGGLGKPEPTVQDLFFEIPQESFDTEDLRRRLTAFMNILSGLKAEISTLTLSLEFSSISLNMVLSKPTVDTLSNDYVKAFINLLGRVAQSRVSADIKLDIRLSKPVAEDNVKKVFGDYLASRRNKIDRLLST